MLHGTHAGAAPACPRLQLVQKPAGHCRRRSGRCTLPRASGLAVDGGGNVFVASNLTIRRIRTTGQVSTVAGTPNVLGSVDGTGAAARFREPRKLAVEPSGNLLISDGTTLRRMTPANVVTTVMGVDGDRAVRLGASPRLNSLGGMAVRPNGRIVLFSEAAVLDATVP